MLSFTLNLKVHSSEETRKYLATIPGRFEFVFTPKHGSWLNLVEGFFSKLTRQMLKGIRVKTKDELVQCLYKYFYEEMRTLLYITGSIVLMRLFQMKKL